MHGELSVIKPRAPQGHTQLLRSGRGGFSLSDRVCCITGAIFIHLDTLSFDSFMCNTAYNLKAVLPLLFFGCPFKVTACTHGNMSLILSTFSTTVCS